MPMTYPNLLTVARLLAAPAVALVFAFLPGRSAEWAALALFVIASLTDYLDGWLARRLGQTTEFGRMLDPIADKAMVMTALGVLLMEVGPDPLLIIPAAIIYLRETAVSGLREHLAGRVSIPVTTLAKWKTTAQMTAIGLMLAAFLGEPLRIAGLTLLWVAAALTAITGWDYFRRGLATPVMTRPTRRAPAPRGAKPGSGDA